MNVKQIIISGVIAIILGTGAFFANGFFFKSDEGKFNGIVSEVRDLKLKLREDLKSITGTVSELKDGLSDIKARVSGLGEEIRRGAETTDRLATNLGSVERKFQDIGNKFSEFGKRFGELGDKVSSFGATVLAVSGGLQEFGEINQEFRRLLEETSYTK